MALSDWTFMPGLSFERQFDRMRRQMDEMLSRMGTGLGADFPGMNIYDQGEELLVAVQAPGVKKDGLNVELRENTLTITGSREAPDYPDADTLREESFYGEFKRSVRLPSKVEQGGIEAHFKNGILMIRLPKAEAAKPKQIAINA